MSSRSDLSSVGISRSEIQKVITGIWEEVLRIDGITAEDDFFELGGHSLTASQVLSRMARDLGAEVTLSDFFQRPTVAELAEFIIAGRQA